MLAVLNRHPMATLQVDDLSIHKVLTDVQPVLFYLNVQWQRGQVCLS
jgi:hypothetical protein